MKIHHQGYAQFGHGHNQRDVWLINSIIQPNNQVAVLCIVRGKGCETYPEDKVYHKHVVCMALNDMERFSKPGEIEITDNAIKISPMCTTEIGKKLEGATT